MIHCYKLLVVTFFLVASMSSNSICGVASQKISHGVTSKKKLRQPALPPTKKLQQEIAKFLSGWLVSHDFSQSLNYFSDSAYTSNVMLQADCAGYIEGSQRNSKEAIKAGVEKFLADFAEGETGRSLNDLLAISHLVQRGLPKASLQDKK